MQDLANREEFENQVLSVIARLPQLTADDALSMVQDTVRNYLVNNIDREERLYAQRYISRHKMRIAIDKRLHFQLVTELYNEVIQLGFTDQSFDMATHLDYAECAIRAGEYSIAKTLLEELRYRLHESMAEKRSSFAEYYLRVINSRLDWLERS